jgi:hypothetical protein
VLKIGLIVDAHTIKGVMVIAVDIAQRGVLALGLFLSTKSDRRVDLGLKQSGRDTFAHAARTVLHEMFEQITHACAIRNLLCQVLIEGAWHPRRKWRSHPRIETRLIGGFLDRLDDLTRIARSFGDLGLHGSRRTIKVIVVEFTGKVVLINLTQGTHVP